MYLDPVPPDFEADAVHRLAVNSITRQPRYRSLRSLLLASVGMVSLLIAAPAAQAACGVNGITRVSSPIFYIDTGINPAPQGMYVAYTVKNNSTSDYPDLWVKVDNFLGTRLSLAPAEDGIAHVGFLASGGTKTVYFYIVESGGSSGKGDLATPQNHTVSLYSTRPDLATSSICSDSFGLTIEETIKAEANKVNSVTFDRSTATLGAAVTMEVDGDTGTIGGNFAAFTPAALLNWPANSIKLLSSTITLSKGNEGTQIDTLYPTFTSSATTHYVIKYTFIPRAITSAVAVLPISYVSSGKQTKHNDIPTTFPTFPATDVNSPVTISKSVSTPTMATGGVTTYTVTLNNTATVPVTLDDIVDILPSTPAVVSYNSGTAKFNGTSIPNPNIAGQKLTFLGNFVVPAGGSSTLTYNATVPNTPGAYTNSAVGHIGSTQIDATAITTDNVPAIATVGVGSADLSLTKTVNNTTPTAGNNVVYTIAVTNNGPNPTAGVVVKDLLPTQVTHVSNDGASSYDPGLGNWTVGSLSNGETKTLKITVKVKTAGSVTNTTQVTAAGSIDPDSTPNNNIATEDDQASVAFTATAPPPANIVIRKRITAIDGNRTKNPNDNTPLNGVLVDSKWPVNYVVGAIDGGKVISGNTIEYTIYFLNAGGAGASNLKICDLITPNQVFKPSTYNSDKGIQFQLGSNGALDLTNAADTIDRGQYIAPTVTLPTKCNLPIGATNDNGTISVGITGAPGNPILDTILGSIGASVPNESHGFIRFTTTVK